MQLLRKEDICDTLGISLATVNNWIKTGLIPAPDLSDYYSSEKYNFIISSITKGSSKLNSRANRSRLDYKLISYLGITDKNRKKLLEEVILTFESSKHSIFEGIVSLSIAMLKSNGLYDKSSKIFEKINEQLSKFENSKNIEGLFECFSIKNADDDFIGAFYQSIQSISIKSNLGSYYTPSELLERIKIPANSKIIDPCCGSGGILLRVLDKKHNPSLIWAKDIDRNALYICAINLALFFDNPNIEPNIEYEDLVFRHLNDFFSPNTKEEFDYIITNPPWGSKLSKTQKDLLIQIYPQLQTTEVYSISLKNSLDMLSKNGKLIFFLPHSFLNVATHKNIRKYILQDRYNISIRLLGNAFKGVLSESVLICMENTIETNLDISIENKVGEKYTINKSQIIAPDYIIPATASNIDDEIVRLLYSREHYSLTDNTEFVLGIVTGNNEKHLTPIKTTKAEPIYRGKDILPFTYASPACFIEFIPENYQQVAPIKYFRSRKIVYRFISDRIICSLDENNSLILNSANLFITQKYPMETIVCLFNSCIYTFIFRKKFHSKKVLKSHLQQLPLPILSEEQHDLFASLYNQAKDQKMSHFEIDKHICKLFMISDEQYAYIKESVNVYRKNKAYPMTANKSQNST